MFPKNCIKYLTLYITQFQPLHFWNILRIANVFAPNQDACAVFLIILFTVIFWSLSLLFCFKLGRLANQKKPFVFLTNPEQPLLIHIGPIISFQIIRDPGSSDADTNGREMTVERQKIHKNYNCSCHGTKLMKSAFILMVLI